MSKSVNAGDLLIDQNGRHMIYLGPYAEFWFFVYSLEEKAVYVLGETSWHNLQNLTLPF
jgi:hypothetical protein